MQLLLWLMATATLCFAKTSAIVKPSVETEPVLSAEDAADDTAVWVHPKNPEKSLIVATDKLAGLLFYNLKGKIVGNYPVGRINNIDVRDGFNLNDTDLQIFVGSDRSNHAITVYTIDPEEIELVQLGSIPLNYEPYGICLSKLDDKNEAMVFVTTKAGPVDTWRIKIGSELKAKNLGQIKIASQTEGCVADEAGDSLFVGEEDVGVWRFELSGTVNGRFNPTLIDRVQPQGNLVADVEGLAIYRTENQGYLVVSSQGDNSYHLYDLKNGKHRGRFEIGPHKSIDGVTDTDGIDVVSVGLNDRFPKGFLIAQDGLNSPSSKSQRRADENQNFKIVDWRDIEKAARLKRNLR